MIKKKPYFPKVDSITVFRLIEPVHILYIYHKDKREK